MNDAIQLAFSPCPNDTFIFNAWANAHITNVPLTKVHLADVQELNEMALAGEADVIKISFGVYPHISAQYQLLDAGAAMGHNCGPLLVAKTFFEIEKHVDAKVAVPGLNTTAYLLFRLAFPQVKQVQPMIFSDIEQAVLIGNAMAGLIIHESRFTYAQKGLIKLLDLGEYWEREYSLPIPLGGIAVRRSLPEPLKWHINDSILRSLLWARAHPHEAMPFVKQHAQEMEESVMQSHIALYVNELSLSMGDLGRQSLRFLFDKAAEKELLPKLVHEPFLI